jgi:hypothetical protein
MLMVKLEHPVGGGMKVGGGGGGGLGGGGGGGGGKMGYQPEIFGKGRVWR